MKAHEWLFDWSHWIWPVVADHLWQATLFSMLAFAAVRLSRRSAARARYFIWFAALLKVALPSALVLFLAEKAGVDARSLLYPASETIALPPVSQIIEPIFQLSEPSVDQQAQFASAGHTEFYCILTIVWAIGFILLFSVWCRRRFEFSRSLRGAETITSGREFCAFARARQLLKIRRDVRLIISPAVTAPGVWRVLNPVVVLPKNLADHIEDSELDGLMTHEFIHISRMDNLASSFQMMLCCLFWFYPVVWLIDRQLLAERERVCDEKVLELGTGAKVYAAGLLKVLKFCLGRKVAGVSSTSGADLGRRIKMITSQQSFSTAPIKHRLLIISTIAVLTFSVAAGMFTNAAATAQGRSSAVDLAEESGARSPENRLLDYQRDATPAPAPDVSLIPGLTDKQVFDDAEKAPYTPALFENAEDAPVRIAAAKVKIVSFGRETREGSTRTYEMVTMPSIALVNNTNERIAGVRVSFTLKPVSRDVIWRRVAIEPRGTYTLQFAADKWANTVRTGLAQGLVIRVEAVQFANGETWGSLASSVAPPEPPEPSEPPRAIENYSPTPPTQPTPQAQPVAPAAPDAPPTPPMELVPPVPGAHTIAPASPFDRVEYVPAEFRNASGTPLEITDAKTKVIIRGGESPAPASQRELSFMPTVTLVNRTDKRIVGLKLRFKADPESHAVTAFRASIEPFGTYTFRSDRVFRSNRAMMGDAKYMRVQLIGVEFEDGSIWGAMDSTINSRDPWVSIPLSISRPR